MGETRPRKTRFVTPRYENSKEPAMPEGHYLLKTFDLLQALQMHNLTRTRCSKAFLSAIDAELESIFHKIAALPKSEQL